jgi:hypothetical protein
LGRDVARQRSTAIPGCRPGLVFGHVLAVRISDGKRQLGVSRPPLCTTRQPCERLWRVLDSTAASIMQPSTAVRAPRSNALAPGGASVASSTLPLASEYTRNCATPGAI